MKKKNKLAYKRELNKKIKEKIITNWGYVIEIGSTDELGVSLLVINPGKKIPAHYHEIMKEYELVIKGSPLVNGRVRREGSLNIWKQGQVHEYVNNSNDEVKILCVTIPPYIQRDEIYVK